MVKVLGFCSGCRQTRADDALLLPHGCGDGSKRAWREIRKASRARAPDSPVPGEHTGESHVTNADIWTYRPAAAKQERSVAV
jgi:hypothetical protein